VSALSIDNLLLFVHFNGLVIRFSSMRANLRTLSPDITADMIPPLPAADYNLPHLEVPTLEEMGYIEQPTHLYPGTLDVLL
jgi:hypothetical protein